MRRARRLFTIALLALGPAACGRSCGCFEGSKTYEKLHGKVEVSLVRNTHWTGGRIPGPVSEFYIHVGTKPPFEEKAYCDHVDMAEDDAGKNVAYRCQGEKAWTVFRLRGGDRRIRECNAPVGTDDKPRFEKLESVRASATRILECEHVDIGYTMKEIVHAVFEDEGSNPAADLASAFAVNGHVAKTDEVDAWDAAVSVLDEPGRARARSGLCAVLTNGTTSHTAYVRAAMRCPLDGPVIAEKSLERMRAIFAAPKTEHENDYNVRELALLWSGLIAGATLPKETGAETCRVLEDKARPSRNEDRTTIGLLLAHTATSCPALDRWLEPGPCDFNLDCDGGLCSRAELAGDLEGWNGPLDGGRRESPPLPTFGRAVLAAAYARGPLPRGIVLPNARRNYDLVDAGSDLPNCNDSDLDAGAVCSCEDLRTLDICDAPLEGKDPLWRKGWCSMRIDDTHRVLRDVHRVCNGPGQRCSKNEWCCPGYGCNDEEICELRVKPQPPEAGADAAARDR